MARKPRSDNDAAKAVAARRQETEDANAEAMRRMDEARPTPTQEENDLAKVGALNPDDKEDDGSGAPVDPRQVNLDAERQRNARADGGTAVYNTRDARPKK
jgi:hypothetical protein